MPREAVEGWVERIAWRLEGGDLTTAGIAAALRDQITAAGYEVIFECGAADCGGFDFRFAVDTIDAPRMYVDLSDYQYLLARGEDRYAALMVSVAHGSGFVQLTLAIPAPAVTAPLSEPTTPAPEGGEGIWQSLGEEGRAVLDVRFTTGSATLDGASSAALSAVADMLAARPDQRLAIVGHTDTEGGLAPNVALSRRRAEAVRQGLIDGYGVDPARLDAEGIGFLAPRASNATEEGRRANRRVEIVLPD